MGKALSSLDETTLKHLQAAGADLNKVTEVNNFLYFRKEKDAVKATSALTHDGFSIRGPSATREGHVVVATTQIVPSRENIASMRQLMEGVAKGSHGDYDGWEAAVTS